ncbi:hypothetical protein [Actinoplanes couchii]|nr:hypothetical protein [Actinoplanes couchii]MDR6318958.1 hypothetical protein [Actinoplanes couchii]
MRKLTMTVAGAVLLLSLVACGQQADESEAQVAAIPGATASGTTAAAATGNADRTFPLGASQEEIDRIYDAYYACWTQHGVPSAPDSGGPLLTYKRNPKKYQAAVDACADKEPLDAPERDPQQNPNFVEDLREEKACMESHGIKMEIRGTGKESQLWAVNDKANIAKANSDEGMQIARDCEIAAFTQK